MARKTIFELLDQAYDFATEVGRIETLFTSELLVFHGSPLTPEAYADHRGLDSMDPRITCLDCNEMRADLNIDAILGRLYFGIDEANLLVYIEYVVNILNLCNRDIAWNHTLTAVRQYEFLHRNIDILLDKAGYERRFADDNKRVLLCQKSAATAAAAEMASDQETALAVCEYNHHILRGNLPEKRRILLKLADELEALKPLLKANNSRFEDDANFLLNNINIRHNNVDPKGPHYKAYVAQLLEEEKLEHWYDETYQLLLLCMLEYDNLERKQAVGALKKSLAGQKQKV